MQLGLKERLLVWLISRLYWCLGALWRVEHLRLPPRVDGARPRIFAHWHGDELLLVGAYRGTGHAILSSRSRDGEIMKRVLTWLGYRVARGSSSKGGAGGLKGLIDLVLKEGADASLAVDGPRGPIYQAKPGILKLAQMTGTPVIPGACAASFRVVFRRAWNKCYLPLPFSRCLILYGDPIPVPAGASEQEIEAIRLHLEKTLIALKQEVEGYFDRSFQPLPLKEAVSGV